VTSAPLTTEQTIEEQPRVRTAPNKSFEGKRRETSPGKQRRQKQRKKKATFNASNKQTPR
jgi:hypothetical protein